MPSLALRIPENYRPGFAKLIGLNEVEFEELLEVLSSSPLISEPEKLKSELKSRIKKIPEDDVMPVLNAVLPLYRILFDTEIPIPELVEEVCKAVEKTAAKEVDLSGTRRDALKERLTRLLSVEGISKTLKATSLLIEHEHVYQNGRIFTDVRPVFGPNPSDLPIAAVIIQMLRVRYLDGKAFKEFFVALDTSDVDKLIAVLERAKKKADSLKVAMEQANIPVVSNE